MGTIKEITVAEFIEKLKSLPQEALIKTGNSYHFSKAHKENPNIINIEMDELTNGSVKEGVKNVILWFEE